MDQRVNGQTMPRRSVHLLEPESCSLATLRLTERELKRRFPPKPTSQRLLVFRWLLGALISSTNAFAPRSSCAVGRSRRLVLMEKRQNRQTGELMRCASSPQNPSARRWTPTTSPFDGRPQISRPVVPSPHRRPPVGAEKHTMIQTLPQQPAPWRRPSQQLQTYHPPIDPLRQPVELIPRIRPLRSRGGASEHSPCRHRATVGRCRDGSRRSTRTPPKCPSAD